MILKIMLMCLIPLFLPFWGSVVVSAHSGVRPLPYEAMGECVWSFEDHLNHLEVELKGSEEVEVHSRFDMTLNLSSPSHIMIPKVSHSMYHPHMTGSPLPMVQAPSPFWCERSNMNGYPQNILSVAVMDLKRSIWVRIQTVLSGMFSFGYPKASWVKGLMKVTLQVPNSCVKSGALIREFRNPKKHLPQWIHHLVTTWESLRDMCTPTFTIPFNRSEVLKTALMILYLSLKMVFMFRGILFLHKLWTPYLASKDMNKGWLYHKEYVCSNKVIKSLMNRKWVTKWYLWCCLIMLM